MDTSVAVPLVVGSHPSHATVVAALTDLDLALTGHSLAETYAVLTRLPGDARLSPADADRVLAAAFGPVLLPDPSTSFRLSQVLARAGVRGGGTYDALVALAARDHGVSVASRDARAAGTYAAVGAQVHAVPS